ncbi:Alpha galactosidase A [Lachnospiraceae bacterium C7]|nr:Alpha galactosidase A [Lachnospiraceae bacterium C7]
MIAQTPPMGWNSWDCYGAAVKEDTVRKNAKYMAEKLKKHGWEYIVVDIQWSEPTAESHEYHPFIELKMDQYSRLIPAEERFPSAKNGKGFKELSDYVHSLGLKFGIHIMRGIPRQAVHRNTKILGTNKTAREIADVDSICHWNTDMYGVNPEAEGAKEYYESIFKLYASWGVDFVKVDDIANHYPHKEIELIDSARKKCGRDMVLSLSPGPAPLKEAEHLKQHANMWRITDDFWDKWELLYDMFDRTYQWSTHYGPGHWPDCDMLPIGAIRQDYDSKNRTLFTKDEQKTMMTLWCIVRSPLMIGADMVYNDEFTESLLTNDDLLEMLKKSRGARQIYRRKQKEKEVIVWCARRKDRGYYLAIFNASEKTDTFKINLDECEIEGNLSKLKEVWTKEEIPYSSEIEVEVNPHGTKGFVIL